MTQPKWAFRLKGQTDLRGEVTASGLSKSLSDGTLDTKYEFLPPGWETWISKVEAEKHLAVSQPEQPALPPRKRQASGNKQPPRSRKTTATAKSDSDHSDVSLPSKNIPKSGRFQPRRKPAAARRHLKIEAEDQDLELMPMIDMIFLLLTFFMIASTMTPLTATDLPNSVTGRAEATEKRVVLLANIPAELLEIADSDEKHQGAVRLLFSDAEIAFGDEPELRIAADELKTALENRFQARSTTQFVLQADRRMPTGIIREITAIAREAGATETLVGVSVPR